ncbi:Peptidyl-arginine deiminase, Porphyromonas-type [Metarhizium album ARSEF 1941]|uniref:Peptidyl-arginine deiminase, Porphyromonas-type n=1 Tax=Metarhizium album (strain ARSEF 1941) TaxID=1081103 RepID=A0A0B2WTP8_METAS|nr:Peptidyl-arginine deiminase, Porphyromonas-type [Metarhizium album ARSEF 1941]KHN96837.1 Peptidyl-arginine deiminase, Porphyromonas-type [Metarhizium album ARSEF 1941]
MATIPSTGRRAIEKLDSEPLCASRGPDCQQWTPGKNPVSPRRQVSRMLERLNMFKVLLPATDAKGRPLEVMEVEEPDEECFEPPPKSGEGTADERPVRSHVNYLPVNGGIILPQFGDPAHDAAAIRTAQRAFGHERRIHPVLVEELPLRGGGIHCRTQEMPMFP